MSMFTVINGIGVFYAAKGKGEPVLLIHGIPTSSFIWRRQVEALSRHYRVYALDLPGWGDSDKPADFDYRLEPYAGVVYGFLKKMGVKKTALVVHDLGGAIGLSFLARHPEMVSKLVILNTFAYLPFSKKLPWALLYGFLYRIPLVGGLLNRLVWYFTVKKSDTFVTLAFYDKKLVTKGLVEEYRRLNRETRLTDYRILIANGIDGITKAVEGNSKKVKVPTLILWAENDMLFPESAALRLHDNIPGSVLETIPECGHFLQEEKPEEVNKRILEFLGR